MLNELLTFNRVEDVGLDGNIWNKQIKIHERKLVVQSTKEARRTLEIELDLGTESVLVQEKSPEGKVVTNTSVEIEKFEFIIHETEFVCRANIGELGEKERFLDIIFKFEEIFLCLSKKCEKYPDALFECKLDEWVKYSQMQVIEIVVEKHKAISEELLKLNGIKILTCSGVVQSVIDKGIRRIEQITFLQEWN